MSRRIMTITAGLSQPSATRLLADRLAQAVSAAVGARGEAAEVETVELRDLASDLATAMTTGGMATERLAGVQVRLSAADGLIAVTPVFTASYSGLFKMFFDSLDTDAVAGMPVLIAATAGTPRHSLVLDHALRPLFAYLRAVVVPTGVFAATEDFGAGEAGPDLSRRIRRAADELATLAVAERTGVGGFAPNPEDRRTSGLGPGPVTPFAELLRGHTGKPG